MKSLIHIILASIVALATISARVPVRKELPEVDLDDIRLQVTDPASPYYYPELMRRFERNETVMTVSDYRYLYLGTMFTEDYNPYRRSTYADKVLPLTYKERHTRAELDTMIKYCGLVLHDTPFDLSQMNFLIYALREKGKVNLANIWQYRMNRLLEAIVSTGTGAEPDQAWYVIYPRDEATIVNMSSKRLQAINPTFVEPYYDCIETTDNQGRTQQYYFNIKSVLEEFNRKYPE